MEMIINEIMKKLIFEQYEEVDYDAFEDALVELSTLNLEDDQVKYPKTDGREHSYLFSSNNYELYLLDSEDLPSSGPFEISITDNDGDEIGFIRGTKSGKIISFNLIHIAEDNRGQGIGTSIYENFLQQGFIIKSDKEITDSTYSIYYNLVKINGFTGLIFDDGRVGVKY